MVAGRSPVFSITTLIGMLLSKLKVMYVFSQVVDHDSERKRQIVKCA